MNAEFASIADLNAALNGICQAPKDAGVLKLIVRRPAVGEREILQEAALDLHEGLVGDNWKARGTPNVECQLTVMNSRATAAVARAKEAWPLAGDQLYIDIDLSADNMPSGTRFSLGTAILEVTALPHTGCKKFKARFGEDALKFVSSKEGMHLRLRGVNARIIQSGTIRVGDPARKLPPVGI